MRVGNPDHQKDVEAARGGKVSGIASGIWIARQGFIISFGGWGMTVYLQEEILSVDMWSWIRAAPSATVFSRMEATYSSAALN
jgi:hypothetical protein